MTWNPDRITVTLDRILPGVSQPARYIGGEWNSIRKEWGAVRSRVALAFPDTYDLGMSNLGLAILYDILNRRPDVLAERVYAPWVDMQAEMRRAGLPLFSLESRHPISRFDILAFSLPYEQLYTNVLTMLDLAGLPLRSADRLPEHPLVLAGGSAMINPEPMWAFLDACFLGEGEEGIGEIVACQAQWRDEGRPGGRTELLRRLARIEGVYIPGFYESVYHADGALQSTRPKPDFADVAPKEVMKRIVAVLPPPVTDFIVPYVDIVHNRAPIEIQRGCTRGCRFCQAGMIFRPVRARPLAEVLAAVDRVVEATGFEEISFLSLSSSDYPFIQALVDGVVDKHGARRLSIGLPSLRIESFSVELMEKLEKGRRRSGFTFAPEAASDRLRDVINKPIATELMLQTAHQVYSRGWTTIKMYFMIGHPTQTLADIEAIAQLGLEVLRIGRRYIGGKAKVNLGVSTLVPKPQTPFQWARMEDEATIRQQQDHLRARLRTGGMNLSLNAPRESLLEAFLCRGDRKLAAVIERAWQLGARFDAWGEQFAWAAWQQAFAEAGLEMDWYARRQRPLEETLPWDHLSVGVKKEFMAAEWLHSLQGAVVDDCREHCFSCGIITQFKEERREAQALVGGDGGWGCPSFGRGAERQPVSPAPVPLYFSQEMNPDLAGDLTVRLPQRQRLLAGRN
ncbi:MAG: TIGR03960 family B12-binding radical SAM protein [Caldilineales bacterium]|nr:TIGR03960 family B12-binding radical SAM protein [Caldilineales bacterium]MCW5860295.1 TIGR03960 family B12-binding radical SAM protein [Caldilineales bacterium]